MLQPGDFLDLSAVVSSGGERDLLGLAFPRDYTTSHRFYVNFTNTAGDTVVARFRRSPASPLVADPSSRFDLRWGGPSGPSVVAQPFANHNGGNLVFGPDGGTSFKGFGLERQWVNDLALNGASTRLFAAVYRGGIYAINVSRTNYQPPCR